MELVYWLIFLMNEIPRKRRIELLQKYKTPEVILYLDKDILKEENINEELINEEKINRAKTDIIYMKKYKIEFISIYDDRYPIYLREIYDPPVGLFAMREYKFIK